MKKIGFMVELTVPDGTSEEQARTDLETAVSFGRPVISLRYVIPGPVPEPDR